MLFYLIIYDLPDTKAANKRRNRLHKMLSGYGKWTQFSVFECFLTKLQFTKLQVQLEGLIKSTEDSVRIYVLDSGAVRKTLTYGSDKPRQEEVIIMWGFLANRSGVYFPGGFAKNLGNLENSMFWTIWGLSRCDEAINFGFWFLTSKGVCQIWRWNPCCIRAAGRGVAIDWILETGLKRVKELIITSY
jgi:CRISPR-associated protein Cas2